MAKRQYRIKQHNLELSVDRWLGQSLSVVLNTGAVFEVRTKSLQQGIVACQDHFGGKHSFLLKHIQELILDFPVAEHAQTSAD